MKDSINNIKYTRRIFCVITVLYFFSLYTYVPTIPTYAESLGASYEMIGIIAGSYGLAQLIFRAPFGIISDKLKNRKLFVKIGIICAIITGIGGYLFSNITALLFFRILSGIAVSNWVAFTVLFSSYYSENEAPKAIGIINSMNMIGQNLGTFIGGVVAEKYSISSSFLIAAICGSLALVLNILIPNEEVKVVKRLENSKLNFGVLKNRKFLTISLLAALVQFMAFATVFGFNPIIAKKLGAGDFQIGLLTTISFLPAIVSAAISGTYFTNKLGIKATLVVGILVQAIFCILTPFVPNLFILYIIQGISGFARGMVFPLLMGLSIRDINQNERATAMGFFQAAYSLGMFIGPTIVGLISGAVGISFGFLVVGTTGIIGAIISVKHNF